MKLILAAELLSEKTNRSSARLGFTVQWFFALFRSNAYVDL